MEQLNIQDAGFIYQDTEQTPMHICGLGIFDQSTSKNKRMDLAGIVDYIQQRIHQAPILQQKLLHPPMELERPFWVADPDFKLEDHVFQLKLDAPGNKKQLTQIVAELAATRMDLDKPLWEIYLVEGLNDFPGVSKGSFAMITKIHHCCVDGGSGNNLFAALVDLSPDAVPPKAEVQEEVEKPKLPGKYEMLTQAYARNTISAAQQTIAFNKRLPSLAKAAVDLYRGRRESGAKLSVPLTRFNRTPDKERAFGFTQFSLKDAKAIKNAVPGTTINDVMVCIVSGGMRKFLDAKGELPEQSLGAMMPKNMRQGDEHNEQSGNKVGGLFASIHSNIEAPLERLTAINVSTTQAKAFAEEMDTGAIFPNLMGGFLYPKVGKAFTKMAQKHRLMERVGPVVLNTVITNVMGPPFDLYHAGAKQLSFMGLPPLTDGGAISHAIYSLNDIVSLGVVSCPSMIDDGEFYIQCCEEAFAELKAKANV